MERSGVIQPAPAASRAWPPSRVLHAGCGGESLPDWLDASVETRLDINPEHSPDFVASITDLGDIGEYDAVYCSHCLEHVHGYEVARTLAEFHRVLRPGGCALIVVPDLEDARPTDEVLYVSPAGPVTGHDLIYGKQELVEHMPHMAHHTGFTAATLALGLEGAGFGPVAVSRISFFNLFGAAVKP